MHLAAGTAAARMAIRLTILVCFALLPTLHATLPALAAPADGPAAASVDAWVNSQGVVRCFPELLFGEAPFWAATQSPQRRHPVADQRSSFTAKPRN